MLRTKIIMVACCAAVVILSFLVWQDLNLMPEATTTRGPDILVNDLDFKRDIGGRVWTVHANRAEHIDGKVNAYDITLTIESASGDAASLRAVSGEMSMDKDAKLMSFYNTNGSLYSGESAFELSTETAFFETVSGEWYFPTFMMISSDRASITGAAASIDKNGKIYFYKGVRAEWKDDH